MARKKGKPAWCRKRQRFIALKGGVLTRSQRLLSVAEISVTDVSHETSSRPPEELALNCSSNAYLALVGSELSPAQRALLTGLELSETQLAETISQQKFPYRLGESLAMKGVPKPGTDHIVSLNGIHNNGLRVLDNGSIRYYRSTPAGPVCLSEEHHWVQENIVRRTLEYEGRKLHRADPPIGKNTKKNKKRRKRKRERQKEDSK